MSGLELLQHKSLPSPPHLLRSLNASANLPLQPSCSPHCPRTCVTQPSSALLFILFLPRGPLYPYNKMLHVLHVHLTVHLLNHSHPKGSLSSFSDILYNSLAIWYGHPAWPSWLLLSIFKQRLTNRRHSIKVFLDQ